MNEGVCKDIDTCIAGQLHLRGLELTKALTACIDAMNPPDKGGISLQTWNERMKAATKQACAAMSLENH